MSIFEALFEAFASPCPKLRQKNKHSFAVDLETASLLSIGSRQAILIEIMEFKQMWRRHRKTFGAPAFKFKILRILCREFRRILGVFSGADQWAGVTLIALSNRNKLISSRIDSHQQTRRFWVQKRRGEIHPRQNESRARVKRQAPTNCRGAPASY